MSALERDWLKLQNILILLLIFTFCLYLPTLFHGAFADDDTYLAYANRFLRESSWIDLYQLFLKPANPWEFLPLRDFTYWLDFRLYGDENGGFHATNLAWYAASGLASYGLFRELILLCRPEWIARAKVLALCGALLFMVHPAHVEVTAWIASRKDLIAATLGFLSLTILVQAMRQAWPWKKMMLAVLLLLLACFGKASAITNILVVMVLFGVGWNSSLEISRARKWSYLCLFWALVVLVFLIHLNVGETSGIRIENHPGVWVMMDRASRIFSALIGILLFPYPLRFYYDVYQIGDWHWAVTASAALLLLISLWILSKRSSLWALGVVLALSPLIVYLQLMPFTTWSLASERFVFFSVAGLSLVLIDLLGRIGRPRIIGGLMLLIALPSAVLVWSRVDDWGESYKLLPREYEMQPSFHNAIRDRIVYTLFAEKRYAEARELARQVRRPYASRALLSLIDAEQAYRQMNDTSSAFPGSEKKVLRLGFCSAVSTLQEAIRNGYASIPAEQDVSYNNMLRTLDKKLKFHYADSKIMCGGSEAMAGR